MPPIALLFEFATLNGGERSMLAVLDRLLRTHSLEYTILAPASGALAQECERRNLRHLNFDVRESNGKRLPQETICSKLIELVRQSGCDLLHANSLAMGKLTGSITHELRIPTTAHLRDIMKLSKTAISHLNRNEWLVSVSQATFDFHVAQGLDAEKTDVIYNGVDCREFQPRPANGSLKRELSLSDDAFLIATIGQISLRKDQFILAEAAATLKERLPNAHYLLVGKRTSNKEETVEFEQGIIDKFTEAGMSDRLHMLGYRNDVPQLLNEIDLLVHPARQEPLGRVLLEAAASGVPIVATNVGGTAEILTDGHSVRLVPSGASQELGESIIELVDDPEKRRQFAENARKEVEHKFRIGRAATELANAWQHLATR